MKGFLEPVIQRQATNAVPEKVAERPTLGGQGANERERMGQLMQMKRDTEREKDFPSGIPQRMNTLPRKGEGQPIPAALQTKMEASLGSDLSQVRLHGDSKQAREVGAQAFTQGQDIHFAPGKLDPHSQQGQELIGHELTHVVQQRTGRVQATGQVDGVPVNSSPLLEQEANQMGAQAAQGQATNAAPVNAPTQSAGSAPIQMQRHDPTVFPWQGTVFGAAKVALAKASDGKESHGDVLKGTEVTVLGKEGSYYKVKAMTDKGTELEGYLPIDNVSGTISELNATTSAIDADLDKMWTDSFNADQTDVKEHGAAIAETGGIISAKNIKKSASGGSVSIDYAMNAGDKLIGDVHTHPYSKSEGGHVGVTFSAGDISSMRTTTSQGFQSLVEAGSERFALVITNETKAKKFFEDNDKSTIKKAYDDAYQAHPGGTVESAIAAVWAVIGKNGINGISFFHTTDADKLKFDAM